MKSLLLFAAVTFTASADAVGQDPQSRTGGGFPAETGVATPRGFKAIEFLLEGNQVLSSNGKRCSIKCIQVSTSLSFVDVALGGRKTLRSTVGHRFSTERGWVMAMDLRIGDLLTGVEPQRVKEITTGLRHIESLRKGDLVLSGIGEATSIERVRRGNSMSLVEISMCGQTVCASRGHRFSTTRGWIKAQDLRVGDLVNTKSRPQSVAKIALTNLKNPVPIYSLVLASADTFRVGSAGRQSPSDSNWRLSSS